MALMIVLWSPLISGADDSPKLGEPVTAETLARIDYTILPNVDGLPEGVGSVSAGEVVYQKHCINCHGVNGTGGVNDALAGGVGSLASTRPIKTVGSFWPYATTVFDYIRRAMPLGAPGTLSDDEVYAVTAYLLHLNGIVDVDSELSAETLPLIRMPNRDGFIRDDSP